MFLDETSPSPSTGSIDDASFGSAGYSGITRDLAIHPFQHDAEQLKVLATQMESFLTRQIERLERELPQAENCESRGSCDQSLAEFQEARERWDRERQQEQLRLQETTEQLIEAWERLETEQREVLKQRLPNKATIGSRSAGSRAVVPMPRADGTVPSLAPLSTSAAEANGTNSHRSQLQFQQLRREMLEHARQRGKR